jgi:glycosyltransferase involved in cell wall biosynthesis
MVQGKTFKILMLSSFFPYSGRDPVPQFLKGLADSLGKSWPELDLMLLVPEAPFRAHYQDEGFTTGYQVFRHPYFWPRSKQALAGTAMLPTIRRQPWMLIQLPFLILAEFFYGLWFSLKFRPGVLWAHWLLPQGLVIAVLGRLLSIPYVVTLHSPDTAILSRLPGGKMLARWVFRGAVKVSAVSKRAAFPVRALFVGEQLKHFEAKLRILPMGVDPMDRQKGEPSIKSARAYLLFVGRLAEKKGLSLLLDAYANLKRTCSPFELPTLKILGDGPDREQLQNKARKLQLQEEISFEGFVGGEEKFRILKGAAAVVLPSISKSPGDAEGLPVVLMEALACGRILVASDVSGADEVLTDGQEGIIFKQNEVDSLTDALRRFIKLSPSERFVMEASARELAAKFYWSNLSSGFKEFLTGKFSQEGKN